MTAALLALALAAADPAGDVRPWTRWWWPGSAVDEATLTRRLAELRAAGFGGVEVCPIYGAKGAEGRYVEFLSPRWVELLAHTTREAKRLGLGVDLTTGTGWPFGGPWVSAGDASAKLVLQKYFVAGGGRISEPLPKGAVRCVRAVTAAGTTIDLTDTVNAGRLDWAAPAGEWTVYVAIQSGPVMKVKRAAPGGVGNVLDPYSVPKLDRYLAHFGRALQGFAAPKPRAFFHDSFEYYQATWTDDLFAQFRTRRGYDLRDHLPALAGDGPADTAARVKHDYRETVSDLHREYIARWTGWCHARGSLSRNQAHGGPGDLLDAYAAADIPECESYGRLEERHLPFAKLASSAAHLTGRPLASAEAFTWLGEHFQVSLGQCRAAADFLFLAGVSHLVFHGVPYSPDDAPWPGWQFYAAVNFGPHGGLWPDLPAFTAYLARCQAALREGRPANDVLLYLPTHDFWQAPDGLLKTFVHPGTWMERHPVHAAATTLWERGYGYDLASDRLLAGAAVVGGRVRLGDGRYRAVVVPECRTLPPATLRKLVELAAAGAKIIVHKRLPDDVPGLGNLDKRQAELAALRAEAGGFAVGDDLDALLTAAQVDREPAVDHGVRFIRRTHAGGHLYFLANRSDKPVDGWVLLATPARSATLLDPLADRTGVARLRRGADGRAEVRLQLAPGESRVLRTFADAEAAGPPWRYWRPAGEPVTLTGTWAVTFVEGGPALPAGFETTALGSWTVRPDAGAFAGTARYALAFDRPPGVPADWLLDRCRVCESARVAVNGQPAGTLIGPPYRLPVGRLLRPGRNELAVEVTNLAANRVADLDRRKVNWKYFHDANLANHPDAGKRGVLDAAGWPPREAGLLGPVTLTPVADE